MATKVACLAVATVVVSVQSPGSHHSRCSEEMKVHWQSASVEDDRLEFSKNFVNEINKSCTKNINIVLYKYWQWIAKKPFCPENIP